MRGGLTTVAEDRILVTEIKGPLEDGWEAKVQRFANQALESTTGSELLG